MDKALSNMLKSPEDWQKKELNDLRDESNRLQKEGVRLKADHQKLVEKNAFLLERPDLPVDRIPAYDRMRKYINELETNCAFFKCCLLSGETPKDGAEPYPRKD